LEGSFWTAVGDLNEVHSELRLRCNRCVLDLLGRLGPSLSVEFATTSSRQRIPIPILIF
jgi:hypothetical protein